MTALAIDSIVVGDRYRHELGDLEALAESIRTVGLLHPVVVTSAHRLVAGQRRLEAVRLLGWTEIPATVAETLDSAALALTAERDENTQRLAMTFSELLPLKDALEEIERPKAAEREAATQAKPGEGRVGGAQLGTPGGKTRDVVAKALGYGHSTMQRVTAVHRIANDPAAPEPVRQVARLAVDEMDRTGKVNPHYQAVQAAVKAHGCQDNVDKPRFVANGKSREAVIEREANIRSLAAAGNTVAQIAQQLGLSEAGTSTICRRAGIATADRILGKRRRINPDSVIDATVNTLDGIITSLDLVDMTALDRSKAEQWAISLDGSLRSLNRLHKQLKEMAHAQHN